MTRAELVEQIFHKRSYLCVGLDTDLSKIPEHLLSAPDPQFAFNQAIIDATKDLCVSYKLNTAFYESQGPKGWESLLKTANYIPREHFKIADAKRGDIGNTSTQYAKAFFEKMNFDAITVSPYMGEDSVRPFLEYDGKWTIVLAATSNEGAMDFELEKSGDEFLYEKVMNKAVQWGSIHNLMFVMGANRVKEIRDARKIAPEHFFLVPGIGSQGGDLKDVSENGLIKECGILANVSRQIIFAGRDKEFANAARKSAQEYKENMQNYLEPFLANLPKT